MTSGWMLPPNFHIKVSDLWLCFLIVDTLLEVRQLDGKAAPRYTELNAYSIITYCFAFLDHSWEEHGINSLHVDH